MSDVCFRRRDSTDRRNTLPISFGAAVVQLQRRAAGGEGRIEADRAAVPVAGFDGRLQVERLVGSKLWKRICDSTA